MELISMTDFVLQKSESTILPLTIQETFKEGAKITNEIFMYAKFINQPLAIGMFIPCDEDGNILDMPNNETLHFAQKTKQYKQAKEKVLFEGFKSTGRFKVSSGFEDFSFLKYKNGNTQVYVTDYTKEESNESLCYTIQDLIKYKLTLTQNAIKKLML